MIELSRDERIRLAALAQVEALRARWDDHVPAGELERGFLFEGQQIRLVGPGMGIFKPRQLGDGPITMRTSLRSSYLDEPAAAGAGLHYDFAPPAREYDNDGLKRLAALCRPLIYLIQVASRNQGSEYAIVAPVYVRAWDDARRTFDISFRPAQQFEGLRDKNGGAVAEAALRDLVEPAYRTIELRARLHQAHFRRVVLRAYRERCTVCGMRVRPLLDAAHIVPDSEGGSASITNGIGMCVLHHRAFDRGILGVRPDYTVRVSADRLSSADAFALRALRDFDGRTIGLPRDPADHPSQEALERLARA